MKTLYKKTSTGATQEWTIEVKGNGYRTISGQVDGKKVVSKWTECAGKNLGKKNETTPEEQAMFEAQSKYKKKLETGYTEYIDKIDDVKFKPMLAQKFEDRIKEVQKAIKDGYCWSQPKLDGIRCIARKDGLFTRNGKRHENLAHIEKELESYFKENPDSILDGEIYNHDFKDDFNELCSIVRKTKPTPEDREYSAKYAEYWIYDKNSQDNFGDRMEELTNLCLTYVFGMVKILETRKIYDMEELDSSESDYIEKGYEGQIVRISDVGYEQKRSKCLLKRKRFIDEEFKIIDIEEGIGNRSGVAGKIILETEEGKLFGAGIRGDYSFFEILLNSKQEYIGQWATIRYFNRTPDENIPRFPVFVNVRDYE